MNFFIKMLCNGVTTCCHAPIPAETMFGHFEPDEGDFPGDFARYVATKEAMMGVY